MEQINVYINIGKTEKKLKKFCNLGIILMSTRNSYHCPWTPDQWAVRC